MDFDFEALFCTGNKSVDLAVDYVYSVLEESQDSTNATHIINGVSDTESAEEEEDILYYKMIFVINTSLKMGVGKIAAQV